MTHVKYKMTPEHKKKISIALIGKNTWAQGRVKTLEEKTKISESHRGEKNSAWKGGISQNKDYRSWLKNKGNREKRIVSSDETRHSYQEWENLKESSHYKCASCDLQEPNIKLTQDHIVSLSKGGSDAITNIQPLCMSCNCKKYTNSTDYSLYPTK